MAEGKSVLETRRDQMFPHLAPQEIERLKRFGEIRHYPAGTLITQTGKVSEGLIFVLKGEIEVRQGSAVAASHGHYPARPRQLPWRAGAALRPAVAGGRRRRDRHRSTGGGGRAAARCAGAGSLAGRAHHAGADPAPRRSFGSRPDRPRPDRTSRLGRHAAAGKFPAAQRPSAPGAGLRHGLLRPDLAEALHHPARASAHRALPGRRDSARSHRRRTGALHRPGQADRCQHGL